MISKCFELKGIVVVFLFRVCLFDVSLWLRRKRELKHAECSKFGSIRQNCDETGQCNCKSFFTGMQCSNCQKGYYFNETQEECLGKNGGSC